MLMWSPSNAYGQYGGVPMRFARRHSAGNARTLLRAASRAVVFHFAVKIVLVAAHDAHVDELAGPQAGVAAVLDLDQAIDLRCVGHRARDRQLTVDRVDDAALHARSEEHTSELQSLIRTSYAVFCLKKKTREEHIATDR